MAHATSTESQLQRSLILALAVLVALAGSGCHAKPRGASKFVYAEVRDVTGQPWMYFNEEFGVTTADGDVINWLYTNANLLAINPSTGVQQRLDMDGGVEITRSGVRLPSYTTSSPTASIRVNFTVTLMGRWEEMADGVEEPPTASNEPFPVQLQLMWKPTGPQAYMTRSRTKSDFISYVEPESSSSTTYRGGSQRYNTTTAAKLVVTQLDTNNELFNGVVSCAPAAELDPCVFMFGASVFQQE
jgi:hypothetical protein